MVDEKRIVKFPASPGRYSNKIGRPSGTSKYKLEDIFEFIVEYKKTHDGYFPTIREIGDECGISSTSHVVWLLDKMRNAGYLYKLDTKGRKLRYGVVGGKWRMEQRDFHVVMQHGQKPGLPD